MAKEANRFLQLRRLYGWTQRDLAEHLEVDPVTVSRWERGVSAPRRRIVRKLQRLLAAADSSKVTGRPSARSTTVASVPTAPSRFEGIDELVRIVGLEKALGALRELALLARAPAPVVFAADPTARLREVESALREQSDLIARAKIRRR